MQKTTNMKKLRWTRSDYSNWSAVRDPDTTYHVGREVRDNGHDRFLPYMIYINRADFSDRNITQLSNKALRSVEEACAICDEHCLNHHTPIEKKLERRGNRLNSGGNELRF